MLIQDAEPNLPAFDNATGEALLLITPGRIAYRGRLGNHCERVIGGTCIYVAGDRPFTLRRGSGIVRSMMEVVPANEMHAVSSEGAEIAQLIIEPETVIDDWHQAYIDRAGRAGFAAQIQKGFDALGKVDAECDLFDLAFFGARLPARHLDRRIRRVVERVGRSPAVKHSANRYAHDVGLSVSRFSHLFRSETGSTLRGFCAWKRVRGALSLISSEERLIETALNAGYADSTHFCHAIRQFFGRRPRDILSIVTRGELTILARSVSPDALQRLAA